MKIAFLTEGSYIGKIPRNHPSRTDQAWICALDAIHYPLNYLIQDNYDIGIVIIPKKCEDTSFNLDEWIDNHLPKIKSRFNKLAFMQEGPNNLFQDLSVPTQLRYLEFLNLVDIIFCHNEYDQLYYRGLFPDKDVRILSSLIIEDALPKEIMAKKEQRSGVMIGGNWVSWYGGLDSFFISNEFIDEPKYAPSMGRKQEYEDYFDDIKYLPYMNWSDWMVELSKRKYAIHLMRTYAAGTFQLNCAYLGIPCLGWNITDTQRICFPELSVEPGNMVKIRKIAKHLYTNEQFYNYVSEYAKKAYHDNFRESIFINKFYQKM